MRVGRHGVLEPCGPGCRLSRYLTWFGVRDDGRCGCAEYARQMDAWGPDECERRLAEILEHLRQAAATKRLPWLDSVARLAVEQAIAAARRERDASEKARQAGV
jgi:hypothetical protein